MGIRLNCPNGHKVHVKSFLAGRRGVCPKCGAKFDIPVVANVVAGDNTGDEIAVLPPSTGEAGDLQQTGPIAASPISKSTTADSAGPTAAIPASPPPDLQGVAAVSGLSLPGGGPFGAANRRLLARQKSARTMRIVSVVLTAAVTLLACVLLYLLMRSR